MARIDFMSRVLAQRLELRRSPLPFSHFLPSINIHGHLDWFVLPNSIENMALIRSQIHAGIACCLVAYPTLRMASSLR